MPVKSSLSIYSRTPESYPEMSHYVATYKTKVFDTSEKYKTHPIRYNKGKIGNNKI